MRIAYHVMSAPGPLGLLFLARTGRGLRHLEFLDKRSIKRTIESRRAISPDATWEASLMDLKPVVDQLEGYFCGAVTRFDVPLDPVGSEFEMQVWRALLDIPFGETRTYGQIAKQVGQPKGSRAVGLANNHNPIAIIVPCHRVIGADGKLTGYGGGIPRKRWLLAHEAHFGALAGVTLDLFAATGSLPTTRIASGDGPPLGTHRHTAPAPRPTTARAASAARSAPARSSSSKSTRTRSTPRGTRPARASSSRSTRNSARSSARPAARPAARNGAKLTARSSRSTRRTAR